MKIQKLFAAIISCAILFLQFDVFASVLGSSKITGYTTQIAEGTYFTHNEFFSDQSGVGRQSENYIVYQPNSTVLPTITHGNALFGTSTISNEVSRLNSFGANIVGGSNADFFSLQTGVPMSNAIVNGKILTKDATGQDAIGIMPDGTAFISYFSLNSVLTKEDGSEINIYNINKYRQPYAVYMMTDDFSDETQNTTSGIDIILGEIDGEIRLGTTLTAVIEAINEEDGSAPIPKGKIVLTIDKKAPLEFFEPVSSLKVGEKVKISFSATGDKRWNDVSLGMGSVGGRLLIDGQINPNLEAGAAPRTAIGITDNNEIVLYTIDGRQTGHSYGVQLKTLAKRMQELGCIDALNLDGGGSTEMVVQLPGNDSAALINKPSDQRERKVSTFFFFSNTAKKTGKAEALHLYPKNNYVMTGASTKLTLKATDSGFYAAKAPSNVNFRIEDGKASTISSDGHFTARDNGQVTVYAESGNLKTKLSITCLETPTDIIIKNQDDETSVKSLAFSPNSKINLTAEAYGGYNKLVASDENFVWEADAEIGSITKDGSFTASDKYGATGNIFVSAGNKTVKIPVTLSKPEADDINAYPIIEILTENGEFVAKYSCNYNISIDTSKTFVKIDGKDVNFEFDEANNLIRGELPNDCGKITVIATNSFGYTSFKSVSSKKAEQAAPFSDTSGHWAEGILGYMYNQKIINGDSTDETLRFNPQKAMTRSEFAVMITNYLGLDRSKYQSVELPYSDIESIPFWALDSFKALYQEGIVKGRYVSDTEVCADPLATINRAEAATIVARVLPQGFFKPLIDAPDASEIPLWAAEGIKTLISIGAINGYEDKSIKPLNTLTKAEAAKILYSIM